jgi:8-oxo-dGTP pyrophosphatase MutT (NUDIX family)
MPIPPYVAELRRKIGNDLLHLPGVAAIVFNDAGDVLLGRRADTGKWSVLGGIVEPDEEPADTVVREVLEETGVICAVIRMTGVYTTPTLTYPNGNRARYVVTAFACRATGGVPRVADDESLEVGYFPTEALPDLSPAHRQRIADALPYRPLSAKPGGMSPFLRELRAKVGHDLLQLVGVSAVVINERGHVLLVHAKETGRWMPVGGMVEPGEEPADAAVREVLEESGVQVAAEHLVGVYDGPAVTYGNGDRSHYVTVVFRCRPIAGQPRCDGFETTDARYFPADQLPPLRDDHRRNIEDAVAGRPDAVFRGGRTEP